jgi:hypothetical protein
MLVVISLTASAILNDQRILPRNFQHLVEVKRPIEPPRRTR